MGKLGKTKTDCIWPNLKNVRSNLFKFILNLYESVIYNVRTLVTMILPITDSCSANLKCTTRN